MNRPILLVAFLVAATAALGAQQTTQSNNPYQGVSHPPADDTITTSNPPEAKPPAGHPATAQPVAKAPAPQQAPEQSAASGASDANLAPVGNVHPALANGDGTDAGIVLVGPKTSGEPIPALATRSYASNEDGDIVHPAPLPPGVLGQGTMIRVRLIGDLSSGFAEKGQEFRSRVSADVEQNGNVLIPAGSEIDGTVAEVSSGHFAGHGSLLLKPERVVLPDGKSYRLHAMVFQTPMSHTNVGTEGMITPTDNLKRDGIEYGGGVGAGVIAGAYLGGPVGALAGGLVGAGLVTTHLLVSHPQARLNSGDVLELTLTQNMRLEPVASNGE